MSKELRELRLTPEEIQVSIAEWERDRYYGGIEDTSSINYILKAQLDKAIPIIQKAGLDEGVRRTTDAMNSTFDAQLKEAREQQQVEDTKYYAEMMKEALDKIRGNAREQRLDRPHLKEAIGRIIARVCGEDFDSYDEEDRDSVFYWAYEILALIPDEKEIREQERNRIFGEIEQVFPWIWQGVNAESWQALQTDQQ